MLVRLIEGEKSLKTVIEALESTENQNKDGNGRPMSMFIDDAIVQCTSVCLSIAASMIRSKVAFQPELALQQQGHHHKHRTSQKDCLSHLDHMLWEGC